MPYPVRLLVAMIILLAASPLPAFEVYRSSSGAPLKWWSPATGYLINDSGGPYDAFWAIVSGMVTWNQAGSNFFFYYIAPSNANNHSDYDGVNLFDFGTLDDGVLAENAVWFDGRSGRIVDCDIRFNVNYPWATDGRGDSYDIQSVATHELGHSLYLGDLYSSGDAEKTMYGYGWPGHTAPRSLHPDDVAGIQFLYGVK